MLHQERFTKQRWYLPPKKDPIQSLYNVILSKNPKKYQAMALNIVEC